MFNPSRLHANLLFTLLALLIPLAIVCALRAARNHQWHPWQFAGVAIIELLLIAEIMLGVVVWAQGIRPTQPIVHIIYAMVALCTLPISLHISQGRTARQVQFIMGLVCLFLIAIVLRALQTGR